MAPRLVVLVVALGLLAGCQEVAPTPAPVTASATTTSVAAAAVRWPTLPRDETARAQLVSDLTRRSEQPREPLTAEVVMAALVEGVQNGSVIGGFGPIVDALQRRIDQHARSGERLYLLFGSHHDAAGQLDVFRRIVGLGGVTPTPLVAVEQLRADGAWQGVDAALQLGDDHDLERWLERGEHAAFEAILARQRQHNYTAWKFRYLDRVADLLLSARASTLSLMGCDMPSKLQARTREQLGGDADLLRDAHCALALERTLTARPTPLVALFWGNAHLSSKRLARFLPSTAQLWRIHLLGYRASSDVGIEGALALRITEPLLVPLQEDRFVLLLDGPHLGKRVDRARVAKPSEDQHNFTVTGAQGTLLLGGDETKLDGSPWQAKLASGPHTFLLRPTSGPALAGAFDLPARGAIELDFSEAEVLRMTVHDPASQ